MSELLVALTKRGGGLVALLPACAVAIGDRIVGPGETISAELAHDVALLPPVAGG
ncbi:MAG: MoaD/ThiS family protein [Microthrixaceae bacterium]